MKNIGIIILSLAILVMLPTAAMAETEIGGNLRIRFNTSEADDSTTFEFDRLALKFSSALSDINGFKSEVQFRKPAKNNTSDGDIRVDNAYYYQKNIFTTDELNIGHIPITWHADKSITILGSLGSDLKPGNSVGIKYIFKGDNFSITGNVLNADNEKKRNANTTGYDLGARGEFSPMDGLTIGTGICNNVINADNDTSTLGIVVDGLYSLGALGLYGEFVSMKATVSDESENAENGFYIEGNYTLTDKFTAYAGISIAEDLIDDRTVIGGKYQLAPGTALQGEFVDREEGDWDFNLRLRLDF